jgi:hypothetical protein
VIVAPGRRARRGFVVLVDPATLRLRSVWSGVDSMSDELTMEELRVRATQEKINDAFRDAMHRAIKTGEEFAPTVFLQHQAPGVR